MMTTRLSTDDNFHFEVLRILAHTRYGGADVGEVLATAYQVKPGDLESWYSNWYARAERVLAHAETLTEPVSIRDTMFRASTYFRAADFFLHGNWDDPRIIDCWEKQMYCFDRAMKLLPIPGERHEVQADGFKVPILFFPASKDRSDKRPTIIMSNGYDGSMEEMLHQCGFAGIERGYNIAICDGPGQPHVRRYQNLGFIPEWEKVVTPVVDYLETRPDVDTSKIGFLGNSMGGYMAPRAAAFEKRLAACICIDGVYDFGASPAFDPKPAEHVLKLDDEGLRRWFNDTSVPVGPRWAMSQGLWAFKIKTPAEFLEAVKAYSLKGLTDKIQCPTFVGRASHDMFFEGQPEMLRDALGDKATMVSFTQDDAAGEHCQIGAPVLCNQEMYDWFERVVVKK